MLEPFTGTIDRTLEDDLKVPWKQRHTAKRIYERLREKHGFAGQYTIVKDYARERWRQTREMFVPLSHLPWPRPVRLRRGMGDHRQGGAEGPLLRPGPAPQRRLLREGLPRGDHGGVSGRPRLGVRLPGRDAPEHRVRQHQAGGGRSWGTDGESARVAFTELRSHYLFEDRFGRPGKQLCWKSSHLGVPRGPVPEHGVEDRQQLVHRPRVKGTFGTP